jgi:ABC-type branched-subunit amino acid transport system ATPase component/ABC-type branched-subunit amino acid transport system permease subunit
MIHGQAISIYIATLLVFLAGTLIAAWGFDLQYGMTRVVNLSFLASQAAGAYLAAVLTIGPPLPGSGETYVLGAHLPWPVAWLAAVGAGALVALVVGLVVAPRLKDSHFAIVTLVIGVGAWNFVSGYVPLFNGDSGVSGVVLPFTNSSLPTAKGFWLMVAISFGLCGVVYWGLRRIHQAPLSRRLRAIRDNQPAAAAIGIDPTHTKLLVMLVGGSLGGLSGAILVNVAGAWSTGSWVILEIVILLTVVLFGGSGNPIGTLVGALILVTGLGQVLAFMPGLNGNADLSANLQIIIIAVIEVAMFWFRPGGLIPERTGGGLEVKASPVPEPYLTDKASLPLGNASPPLVAPGASNGNGNGDVVPGGSTTGGPWDTHLPILEVRDLEVKFGRVAAVQGCSFDVAPGITFLVGPNGAGKSTVVASIAGSVAATKGQIVFAGHRLAGGARTRTKAGVARTWQLPQEFGTMTVLENVMVALPSKTGTTILSALFGKRRWRDTERLSVAESEELLRQCGLGAVTSMRASRLSGGQRKLLELARAVACKPKLILLDEPTAGVSPNLSEQMAGVFRSLRSRGISLIIVSHEMSFVSALSDDVIVMADGKVLVQGTFDTVSEHETVQDVYLGRAQRKVVLPSDD